MAKYCPLPTKFSCLRHNTRFGYESRIVIYYRTILREIQIFNLQTWNNKKINPPSYRKAYNRSIRGAVLAANEESLLTVNRRKSNLFFWSLDLTEGRRKVRWSPFVDGGTQKRSLNLQIPVHLPETTSQEIGKGCVILATIWSSAVSSRTRRGWVSLMADLLRPASFWFGGFHSWGIV